MQVSAVEVYKEKCSELEKLVKKIGKATKQREKEFEHELSYQKEIIRKQYDDKIEKLENQIKAFQQNSNTCDDKNMIKTNLE